MYGMSPHTLYYKLMDNGVNLEDKELQDKYGAYSGMELAKVIYDKYFDTYTGVDSYIEEQKERGRQNEEVFTLLGRKKRLPRINTGSRKEKGYFERLAVNGQIQGCLNGNHKIWVKDKGMKKLKDCNIGKEIELWDGYKFTKGIPSYSGLKEEYLIKLKTGQVISCSKDHKFLTVNTKGNENWKTVNEFSKVEKIRVSSEVKKVKDSKIGKFFTVDKVIKTDKKIPMYDILNTDDGYFMVEGIITHNSAADIIISAQLKLEKNKTLQKLDAKQLFQVHDEQLFELPKKNLDKAIPIIVEEMEDPFNGRIKMNVDLTVSYDTGNSYYEAK